MRRHKRYRKLYIIFMTLFLVVVMGIFAFKFYSDKQLTIKADNMPEESNRIYIEKQLKKAYEAENEKLQQEELQQIISDNLPGIICWGDSLTTGVGGDGTTYPSILQSLINQNIYDIPVVNAGVGGETSITIAGRAGVIPYIVKGFTIPADQTPVQISFNSSNGSHVAPLRQGDHFNPCIVGGVEGTISIVQETYISKEFSYYFTRSMAGNETIIEDDTEIIPSYILAYKNYLPIIFIGQNGGWKDVDDLKAQIQAIIDKYGNHEHYLVLGLTTDTAVSRADIEQDMLEEFGEHYINLREHISADGMMLAGLLATEEDKKAIEVGSIPPSLLHDTVHFNSLGYDLIGSVVYDRMNELGYLNKIQ